MLVIRKKKNEIIGFDENNEPETRLGRAGRYFRKTIATIFVILFLVATFFVVQFNVRYDVYTVSGESMQTTLNANYYSEKVGNKTIEYNQDVVYACKNQAPERGGIGIFQSDEIKNEDGTLTNIIKRVIGLEGDTVNIVPKKVSVTEEVYDEATDTTTLNTIEKTIYVTVIKVKGSDTWTEVNEDYLDDDVSNQKKYNQLLAYKKEHNIKSTDGVLVPEDSYFILGDNRQNSKDSAVIGPVNKCLGRVDFILYYNIDKGTAKNFWQTLSFMFQLKF